jgi:hypothetical protein
MWTPGDYHLEGKRRPVAELAGAVFERVCRVGFAAPGFALIDLGPSCGSREMRARMVQLKEHLSDLSRRSRGQAVRFRSLGRFDQQVTTKFHLDGGPDESLLMLGYEPTPVRSRLYLADYTRCAHDRGITPKQFLDDFNPMFAGGEALLRPYVTEVTTADPGRYQILLLNNSSRAYSAAEPGWLGVMHKAEILNPDPGAGRIVNSGMIAVGSAPAGGDIVSRAEQDAFLQTDQVSKRL